MSIGITAITGPEGSGKSCLLTAFCVAHVELGGRLASFPGYAVYDKNGVRLDNEGIPKGKAVSEEIPLEEWVTMPPDLRNLVLAIDEIQNFFNAHQWQSRLVDIFASVAGQRRKRNLGIVYTTQDIMEIPKILRDKTHYEIKCWDMFWANSTMEKKVDRGMLARLTLIDRKGFLTGFPMTELPGGFFHPQLYYDRYDTNAVVDIWQKFTKVEVKRKVLKVNPWEEEEAKQEQANEAVEKEVPGFNNSPMNANEKAELAVQLFRQGMDAKTITKMMRQM